MKKRLLTLLGGALLGLFSMNVTAQNWVDVTDTYLKNAGFDVADDMQTGNLTVSPTTNKGVTSWTYVGSNSWAASGCIAYGSAGQINGASIPSKDANEGTVGGALAITGAWDDGSGYASYTQAVTLPAGKYKMEFVVNNVGQNSNFRTSYFGFKTSAKNYYGTTTSFPVNTWTTESVEFSLSEETAGNASVGFGWKHAGSGSTPKLVIDYVKLYFDNTVDKTNLSALITTAEGLYSVSGNEAAAFKTAIDAAKAVNTNTAATIADVLGAETALQTAIDAYKLANASASNPVDFTTQIGNIAGSTAGWTFTTGAQNRVYKTSTEKNTSEYVASGFIENWNPSAFTGKISYTITGLPAGSYRVSAFAFDSTKSGNVYFFAGNKEVALDNTTDKFSNPVITGAVVEENAGLEVGLNIKSSASNWVGIASIKVEYIGYDATAALEALAETVEAATYSDKHSVKSEEDLQTAIAAANVLITAGTATKDAIATATTSLSSAIAAVEASVADYANLQAVIAAASYAVITPSYTALATAKATAQGIYDAATAESCADAIATLDAAVKAAKVADYSYVTTNFQHGVELGSWNAEGPTGTLSDQHWSGEARPYMEQSSAAWGWSAWSITYDQDVTLPAGDYVFKAAGRKAAGNGCTLQLVVTNKATSAVIGTVSDFPEGDVGLGINKAGATSFDSSDSEGFANAGAGRGFQWRFVKFTLTESTTINVAVSAAATTNHQWVSFCDATVQTNNEANISMIAYNIALNDAKAALTADAYKNVVTAAGKEYGDLDDLVNADPGDTKAEIEAATAELKATTQAFKDAAPSYDDYYAAKAEVVAELPYATADKYAALQSALTGSPASASGAVTKAAAIRKANRAYVESNSVAEGIEGIDWSELVNNTDFVADLEGWTSSQSGGNLQQMNSESPVDSYDFAYCYYDYYNNSANNQHASQTISKLPVGKYMLSVMARADANLNGVFIKFGDQETEVSRIGASGGVFGRGWNIYTVEYSNEAVQDVTIEVYSTSTGGNKSGWFGFTRVRLIKIQDYATMSINAKAGWGTFAAPFDVELPAGVEAYTIRGYEGNALTLSEAITGTLPAFTAALVYKEGGMDPVTFSGKATDRLTTANTSHYLVGVFQPTLATAGNYVLMLNDEDKAVFGQVVAGDEPTIGANRCYLQLSDPEPPTQQLRLPNTGGSTHIQSAEQQNDAVVYDLTGRRVDAAAKGIYIVNGKKMLVK